ncbi:hypothetical protein NA56DRAFT_85059 [Hyaloscypha hepaticicola]|uniref:Uncharacterized protein n=1 Tax=Hyaloscypha hepaticicola TaxID=2082293 RepID=A0A2J6Q9W3_9HELO|nr:hypothetical protein NA56DRAFT_85059 [Hyaloscypha hepaticicola]
MLPRSFLRIPDLSFRLAFQPPPPPSHRRLLAHLKHLSGLPNISLSSSTHSSIITPRPRFSSLKVPIVPIPSNPAVQARHQPPPSCCHSQINNNPVANLIYYHESRTNAPHSHPPFTLYFHFHNSSNSSAPHFLK